MGVIVKERRGAWWLFINHKGRRKAKKVGDKKAAELAAVQIRARLALGDTGIVEHDAKKVMTVQEAAEAWLATYGELGQLRKSTRALYSRNLKAYVFPRVGTKPVASLKREDIRDLVADLLAQGKSKSLVRNVVAPIRQTFNQLIEDEVVSVNPAARIGRYLKDKGDPRFRIDPLLPYEEAILLETMQTHYSRHYPLILCAVRTGLRLGELFGLQWGDLDFENRFVEVRRTLQEGGGWRLRRMARFGASICPASWPKS